MVSLASFHEQQRLLPADLEDRLTAFLKRSSGGLLLLTISAIWISLLTWSASDPSLTYATSSEVTNSLGRTGATIAGLLLESLGLAVAVALLAPMLWAIELLITEEIENFRTKVLYYPLNVLSLAAVLSALPNPAQWPIPHGLGGILGDLVFEFSSALIALANAENGGPITGILLTVISVLLLGQGLGLKLAGPDALPRTSDRGRGYEHTYAQHPQEQARGKIFTHTTDWSWWPFSSRNDANPAWRADERNEMPTLHPHQAPQPTVYGSWDGEARELQEDANEYRRDDYRDPGLANPGGITPDHPYIESDQPHFAPLDGIEDDPFDMSIAERFAPANARANQHPGERNTHTPSPEPRPAPARKSFSFFGNTQPKANEPTRTAPEKPTRNERNRGRANATFQHPTTALLKKIQPNRNRSDLSQTVLRGTARLLEDVLQDFGIKGEIRDIRPGPVVTLFELEPARGTKASRVIALADDIARSMSAKSARVAVIPGRNAIGIEISNAKRDAVGLRDLLESQPFQGFDGTLPLALGKSISGDPVVADLARMPHLLVAGTTGSGKSVGINAMILSLLYRHTPEQCRMIMIDPKMLELSVYNDIPHLLCPVITEPNKAVGALNWAVTEMEERYKRMAKISVRNIEAFNTKVQAAAARGTQLGRTVHTGYNEATGQPIYEREDVDLAPMPFIVVVVDEFADLMITAGKEIELSVQRLAQKARAAGIHLIMATQRPSVDIITGTIKSNFPTRVSYRVASKIDSRTILNDHGAEQLLGQGDMLFSSGSGQMVRVHGPFVSDEEVETVTNHLRQQDTPRYVEGIDVEPAEPGHPKAAATQPGNDAESLYDRAVAIVLRDKKASTSYIQRRLSIGYNRAADLIERMENEGLISAPNHSGRREILAGDSQEPRVSA